MTKLRIALTSGYAASKHAIALLHQLSRLADVDVVLCLEVKTFSYRRVRQLLRMYGPRDAWGKFRNIFFPSPDNRFADETAFIDKFLKENDILFRRTAEASRALAIRYAAVKSLNDQRAVDLIREHTIDLIVYSGGGILKKDIIAAPSVGVLNVHSGPLPFFRGMNCLEWTLLHGVRPALSVHLIDRGIDTGPILARFPQEISAADTIVSLRGKSVVGEVKALCEVVGKFNAYYGKRTTQTAEQGKQFFTMHPLLKAVLEEKIRNHQTPVMDYTEFTRENQQH